MHRAARLLAIGLSLLSACSTSGSIKAPASPPIAATPGIRVNPGGPDLDRYTNGLGQYPRATPQAWWQPAYSVDAFSRMDEIFNARVVRRAATPSPWRRAAAEPAVQYLIPPVRGGGRANIDGYLSRNPTTGLLVAVGDTIHVERYQYARSETHRFISFSMAKTICAILVGLAVADGAIASIDDPAEKYVPSLKGSEYGRTPIRHLLTMSSGVQFREDYDGIDDAARLSRAILAGQGGAGAVRQFNTREAAPGARWYYASAESQVLGLVLTGALKRPIAEYLSERLWQPVGAEADASWVIDRTGQENTSSNFNAVLRDYARLGMLLANGGKVGDRQVVPADWLREMTRAHFTGTQTGRWFGYGFQTWIFPDNDGSFALLGVRGQTIFVDPQRRLVMVHTAVRPDARDPGGAEATALWRGLRQHFPRRS
ncbi:MAG: beta-lactamase family protein [Ferrovibrio sp.]|uniref:serine hydrolase domain-containing protein n=1 Tax=Ferrovibrio sp. TaxID=1917215 RepID=UPI0026399D96|nr:serine hydrolase [Ferrovibrio sp.]MCW0233857.1 beta-lactamase family protein [Ferrovibrio sp.]